jgi:signal transduction histidine kinase
MARPRLAGLTEGKLRLGLGLLFVALALPTAVLIDHAYGQLKWEAFHRHSVLAEEFVERVDARLATLVATEEARAVTDYAFLVVAGDPAARYVARSPLAAFPVTSALPGVIGHFEVDADGRFGSPLLPDAGVDPTRYGVAADELAARRERVARIHDVLGRGRLGDAVALAEKRDRRLDAPQAPDLTAVDEATSDDVRANEAAPLAEGKDKVAKRAASSAPAESKAEAEAKSAPSQALFDRLASEPSGREQAERSKALRSLGRVEELQLEQRFRDEADAVRRQAAPAAMAPSAPEPLPRQARKERNVLFAPPADADRETEGAAADAGAGASFAAGRLPIRTFESDVEPFRFALLDGDHFVLYRNVWRDGRRTVQGLLLAREALLRELFQQPFAATALATASDLLVAWEGDVLGAFSRPESGRYLARADELRGELLHRARLSAPLSGLELIFSVTRLPPGPGAGVVAWVGALLAVVLCVGFLLLYRLGLGQIRLVRQQQDFVSAVSHELKTPLTSIRMYGEMLREGWVDETRRRDYYDYIHGESERLSRLIDNVLQLARMNRNGLRVALQPVAAGELCDQVRSRIASQVEHAGFTLAIDCDGDSAATVVTVDPDLFLQIVINLVDNALKFAASAEQRRIDLGCRRQRDGTLLVTVRDHGPGVPSDQMKKIFRLFYRPGDELTRETVGTGIGLALVHQLAVAMGGSVDVVNRDPGAEFRLLLRPDKRLPG